MRGAGLRQRRRNGIAGRTGRRDVVAQRKLEADEVLEDRGDARPPRLDVELAQVGAIDFDCTLLRIVQTAEQLGDRRLAGAVLSDDRQRRSGGNGEIEIGQHRLA